LPYGKPEIRGGPDPAAAVKRTEQGRPGHLEGTTGEGGTARRRTSRPPALKPGSAG